MKHKKNRIIRSKLKLKGKFAKNRKRQEREIKREIIEKKERELLSKIELFGNLEADGLLEGSKELQNRLKSDIFIRNFVEKETKNTREWITERFGMQAAEVIKFDFKIIRINHEEVEIKQSFTEIDGKIIFAN